jgi:hypothetical protein
LHQAREVYSEIATGRGQNAMVRRNPAGDSKEGRGRQLARDVEPWFILFSILFTPEANFHAINSSG